MDACNNVSNNSIQQLTPPLARLAKKERKTKKKKRTKQIHDCIACHTQRKQPPLDRKGTLLVHSWLLSSSLRMSSKVRFVDMVVAVVFVAGSGGRGLHRALPPSPCRRCHLFFLCRRRGTEELQYARRHATNVPLCVCGWWGQACIDSS